MGALSYKNSKFIFASDSRMEESEAIRAGLVSSDGTALLSTRNFHKARLLRRFADSSAERKLKRHFITDLQPPESLIYPDHLAPRSWQIESAWHALSRTPSYIADEAGLGKTATAIIAVNSSPGRTLIICPPYLRHNWEREITHWAVSLEGYQIMIWPDSQLKDIESFRRDVALIGSFKWLIVDEAHRYKTEDAQRTKALLGDDNATGLTDFAERTVFLSGTPFPNGRPIELYSLLSHIAPESILHRSAEEYWKEFCGGRSTTRYEMGRPVVHRDLQGASNLKRLRKELRLKFMVRHLKKNCLKELGPKTRQIIFLDAPKDFLRLEKEQFKDVPLDSLLGEDHTLGDVALHRKKIGVVKMRAALEFIQDKLESSKEKIVISACHIEVVEYLHEHLKKYGALKIRGGMSAKEKSDAVHLFQTSDAPRAIVGNTLSIGLGNTLTKARTLIVVEPEWSPGVNEQMEDRVHRISQDKHVYCIYLVLKNSLDERILHRALGKEANIQTVMN